MASRVDSDRLDFAVRQRALSAAGRAATPQTEVDPTIGGSPPFEGIDLVAADALSELGWDAPTIRLILSGPDHVSIHEIANHSVAGTVDEGQPGSVIDQETDGPPASTAPTRPKALYWASSYGQAAIVQAIWADLHGDPIALADLGKNLKELPPVLQAYLLAAIEAGQGGYVELEKWLADFGRQQSALQASMSSSTREREAAVAAAIRVAAAAASTVRVVGPALAVLLALGLAIREALIGAFPTPAREREDQTSGGHEGVDLFFGIRSASDSSLLIQDRYRLAKQWVVEDATAFQLPPVPLRAAFPFAPNTDEFHDAADKLGLNGGK